MEVELAVLEVRVNRSEKEQNMTLEKALMILEKLGDGLSNGNYWITSDWINVDEDEEEKLNNDTIVTLDVVIKEMKLGSKKIEELKKQDVMIIGGKDELHKKSGGTLECRNRRTLHTSFQERKKTDKKLLPQRRKRTDDKNRRK